MVISDEFEFIYIDVPKTGSISFERLFKETFSGKTVFPEGSNLTKHCRKIPQHAQNYRKIISVRNPYERIKSLYSFHLQRQKELNCEYGISNFLDKIIEEREQYQNSEFLMYLSIHDYLLPFDLYNSDCVIQLENAEEQINQLELINEPVKLPWRNQGDTETIKLLSDDIIKKVNIWAQNDFESFGYKKIT